MYSARPRMAQPIRASRSDSRVVVGSILPAMLIGTSLMVAATAVPAQPPKASTQPAEVRVKETPGARSYRRAVLIRFTGPITPLLEQFVFRKLDLAQRRNADLVIIEIDSPGGFLDSSFNVASRLRDLDWAETVAFIPNEALSGAAIVALGCDTIIMARDARIGDAGAIFQGQDALFRYAPEKIRTDLARRIRDLASSKGRPPALAEAMVDMDLVVYHVRNASTEETGLMTDPEIAASDDPAEWVKLKPIIESREAHFLELNGERAVALGLAGRVAASRKEVRDQLRIDGELLILEPTVVDTTVTVLNFSFVTGLLLVVAVVALLFEASAPGIGIGGLVSGLCFALFFWSRFLGGTAGWLEVILFAAGLVFIAIELFVIPGFGVAGVSGLLLVLASILMASQHFVVPHTGRELNTTVNSLTMIVGTGVAVILATAAISYFRGSIPVLSWLALQPVEVKPRDAAAADGKAKPSPALGERRFPVQVGDWGVAESPLRPAGRVRFQDDYVDVVSDGSFVSAGQQVTVTKISGNRVQVRAVEETA